MQVRADKFYPPRVESTQFLFRERLVGELLRRLGPGHPLVLVEAQAGQGKTTLVKQLLDRMGTASAWYQVGPEDADPAFMLPAIQACVTHLLPECSSEASKSGMVGGEISMVDLPRRIDLLLADLHACLASDLYLVFDDLHCLAGCRESLFILDYMVEHAPPRLRFVLSSREPVLLKVWSDNGERRKVARIDNHDLALGEHEVAELMQQAFGLSIAQDAAENIAAVTDGWIMGIRLIAMQMARGQGASPPVSRFSMGHAELLEYFRRTVFDPLEPHLRGPLLTLSLLEDIPVDLAAALTGGAAIGDDLRHLVRHNIFIRQLDPQGTVFALHHLFRQFLREAALAELGEAGVRRVHRQAGLFFAGRNAPAQALRHLLRAGDLPGMEDVLRVSGTAMLAANQTATLEATLGQAPRESLERLGWVPFYLGLARMDSAPAQALPLLRLALAVFSGRGDEHGELLCLAHLISIHITTTGHYREGEGVLLRAEELFSRAADGLDASTTILLARSLAMGRCIFLADTDTATRYASLALTLAKREGLINFEAALLMVMGYIQIFAGNMSLARLWLEQAAQLVNRPEVGSFNRLSIRMMLFNFLFHDGQFDNYFEQKGMLIADIGNHMVSQSIAGPFCAVWEMDIALNNGDFEAALQLADRSLLEPLSPHLRSQVTQLQAVALASIGRAEEALLALAESERLRALGGGRYFITLNALLGGLTCGLTGDAARAFTLLDEGVEGARRMPTAYLEACGLMHRAWLRLRTGDTARAAEDAVGGLGLMRRNGYRHFWAWTPEAATAVLGFAVSRGIEQEYARMLGAERFGVSFPEDGAAVPLLEFKTLGRFALYCCGRPVLEAEALTPAQRELLCLLLASPGLKMSQETAQLHFWPDSSPAAVKAKFDTMLSRLRKTLAEALPDGTASHYLNRDKGVIWLAHCRVDAQEFLSLAEKGLGHIRLQEYWQAGNAFTRAEALWQGDFAPGVTGEDRVRSLRDHLCKTLAQMAQVWCNRLSATNRLQTAVALAEKALQADAFNESLWALLYRMNGQVSALKARKVLDRLVRLLHSEDYSEREIAEVVKTVLTPPSASVSGRNQA